jgi:Holliday junction DNA helicase RuvA
VGKKTAERLLIEMRDRLKDWQSQQINSVASGDDVMPEQLSTELNNETTFISDNKGDAINALVSLGYKQVQADKAVKAVYNRGMSSEDIIRDALKSML